MGNQLFVFYSRENDQQQTVSAYHHFASDHARQIGITLMITDVDLDSASTSDLRFYDMNCSIACVAVRDNQKIGGICNPPLDELDSLIDSLAA